MSSSPQDNPVPSVGMKPTSDLREFYDAKATAYHTLASHTGEREQRVLQFFPPGQRLRVLDVGCGSGRFLRILKNLGHQATGVDISNQAVRTARDSGVTAFVGNLETFEGFQAVGKEYDVITLLDVLEHTFNPSAVLKGLTPLLKPEGSIIASVPNIACIHARLTLLAGHFPSRPGGTFDSGHVRWFTRSNLEAYIQPAGNLSLADYTTTSIPPVARFGLWRLERQQATILRGLAFLWPSLWGYQHIFRLCLKP